MEKILAVLSLLILIGCESREEKELVLSSLDNKPCIKYSMHSTHVTVISNDEFRKDDNTIIKLYFTGGTSPKLEPGSRGVLTASCPSFGCEDQTYFFYSLKEDK